MLLALIALTAWLPAIVGFGFRPDLRGGPLFRTGLAGITGLAVLAALAVALHLAVPLSPGLSAAVLGAGWLLFVLRRRSLLRGLRPRHLGLVAGLVVAAAALAQLPARHYDTGLYFLQSVRWVKEHAQVAGLASLHPRLGYNSSWFALAALLEAPGAVGQSSFFLNGFPAIFAALLAADAIADLRLGARSVSAFYFALAVFPAAFGANTLASLYPDQPVAIVTVLSLGCWLRALEDPAELVPAALAGAFLAAFAFTAKLSTVVLLAAWVPFLAWRSRDLGRRGRLVAVLGGAAVLVPWIARGLMTSGCVLFPAAWSCLPSLPWATPTALAAEIERMVWAWARVPGAPIEETHLMGWAWLPSWAARELPAPHVGIPVVGSALALLLAPGRLLRARVVHGPLLVALGGVAFWFLTAPSPRFGIAFLLATAMLSIAAWAAGAAPGMGPWGRRAGILLATVAAVAYLQWSIRPLRKLRRDTIAVASWPALPSARVEPRATAPGTTVSVPVSGDQCWGAALPCTPWHAPGLEWTGGRFRAGAAD